MALTQEEKVEITDLLLIGRQYLRMTLAEAEARGDTRRAHRTRCNWARMTAAIDLLQRELVQP